MTRTCENCGDVFDPYEIDEEGRTMFCSEECRDEAALAEVYKDEPEGE